MYVKTKICHIWQRKLGQWYNNGKNYCKVTARVKSYILHTSYELLYICELRVTICCTSYFSKKSFGNTISDLFATWKYMMKQRVEYQHEEKISCITFFQTYGVLTIFHKMKNSRSKESNFVLRQGIEEVLNLKKTLKTVGMYLKILTGKNTLKLNSSAYKKYEHGYLGRWYIKLTLFKRF